MMLDGNLPDDKQGLRLGVNERHQVDNSNEQKQFRVSRKDEDPDSYV